MRSGRRVNPGLRHRKGAGDILRRLVTNVSHKSVGGDIADSVFSRKSEASMNG